MLRTAGILHYGLLYTIASISQIYNNPITEHRITQIEFYSRLDGLATIINLF